MCDPEDRPCGAPDTTEQTGAEGEDFVFRFGLEELNPSEVGYDDPLLELIRGQLADLLDAAILTYHGQRVMIDGFRLIQEPDTQYEIFPRQGESQ